MSASRNGHREKQMIPAYVLGVLEPEERLHLVRHLEKCAQCRADEQAYEEVATLLPYAVEEVEPPPDLKERLLRAVESTTAPPTPAHVSPALAEAATHRGKWRSARLAPVAAFLLLALLLVLGGLLLWPEQQRVADVAPAGFSVVLLQPGASAPEARGVMLISADGEYGTLIAQNLPEPEGNRRYKAWLVRDELYDGGIFTPDDGYASLTVEPGPSLSTFTRVFITLEPSGESAAPTGPVILSSDI
ncbi:MAG: anti-sigma factor [Candidatus Promineifilaceae bacterium]|nr:anti-sigma factor [Candidatus Promineifilaceae bacterium]